MEESYHVSKMYTFDCYDFAAAAAVVADSAAVLIHPFYDSLQVFESFILHLVFHFFLILLFVTGVYIFCTWLLVLSHLWLWITKKGNKNEIHRSKRVGDRDHWLLIIYTSLNRFSACQETSLIFDYFNAHESTSLIREATISMAANKEIECRVVFGRNRRIHRQQFVYHIQIIYSKWLQLREECVHFQNATALKRSIVLRHSRLGLGQTWPFVH